MRLFKRLFFLAIILAAGMALVVRQAIVSPLPLLAERIEFIVPSGSGLNAAAELISAAGAGIPGWQLALLGRVMGRATQIKAGSYEFEAGITPRALLNKLTRGDVTQADLALIEGWNFRQFRAALDRHPDLIHDSLGLTDAQILERIGAAARHPEGLFFPDTYLFARKTSDLDVLRRAYRNQQKMLLREWALRAEGLPYKDPYQALIMASIVEKETGQAADRPMVASVFINRLRAGMLP